MKPKTLRQDSLHRSRPAVASAGPGQRLFDRAQRARDQGKPVQAELLYRKSLALRSKLLGPGHPAAAQSMNHLASVLTEQGQHGEAEKLYRESLAVRKKALGAEHRDVAASLSNLANLLQATGRFREAERLYRQSLELREKAYGPQIYLSNS
jgi:tetratricopeptide (TPR) repeat protein